MSTDQLLLEQSEKWCFLFVFVLGHNANKKYRIFNKNKGENRYWIDKQRVLPHTASRYLPAPILTGQHLKHSDWMFSGNNDILRACCSKVHASKQPPNNSYTQKGSEAKKIREVHIST